MVRLFKAHRASPGKAAPESRNPEAPKPATQPDSPVVAKPEAKAGEKTQEQRPKEIGGPEGPEPTRYGDWERKGICYDF